MAVTEHRRRGGIGHGLIAAAIAHCFACNGHRLIVSTAAADTGNLRFYQRQGFRMYRIVRDAFGPSNGYPKGTMVDGIALRDQVFLELSLSTMSRGEFTEYDFPGHACTLRSSQKDNAIPWKEEEA